MVSWSATGRSHSLFSAKQGRNGAPTYCVVLLMREKSNDQGSLTSTERTGIQISTKTPWLFKKQNFPRFLLAVLAVQLSNGLFSLEKMLRSTVLRARTVSRVPAPHFLGGCASHLPLPKSLSPLHRHFSSASLCSSKESSVTGLGPLSFNKAPRVIGTPTTTSRPTVVVLGSGWGAISFLKHIDSTRYNIVIISPRSYFLFTPLLPSCPVGTVDEKSIIEPVVSFANKKSGDITYYEAEARSINPHSNTVTIKSFTNITTSHDVGINYGLRANDVVDIKYDYLVSSVGAVPNTFGIPGVEEHACFLKEISDSQQIRHRFIEAVEKANLLPKGDPERKRLLTIVVVGGGPTGVETAAELQDYIDHDLRTYMPSLVEEVKIVLIEALPVVLSMFEEKLTTYAEKALKSTNIDLKTKTAVSKVEEKYLIAKTVDEDGNSEQVELPYGVLVWATGNKPRPLITDLYKKIPQQNDARSGLVVDEFLRVQGTNNVFAIGDNAFAKLPPTAQVAHQSAEYLCLVMNRMAHIPGFHEKLSQRKEKVDLLLQDYKFKPFQYIHLGSLAYLGHDRAIANITYGKRSFYSGGGVFTFYIWRALYLGMILSWRSRFKVMADWLKISVFGRDAFKEL